MFSRKFSLSISTLLWISLMLLCIGSFIGQALHRDGPAERTHPLPSALDYATKPPLTRAAFISEITGLRGREIQRRLGSPYDCLYTKTHAFWIYRGLTIRPSSDNRDTATILIFTLGDTGSGDTPGIERQSKVSDIAFSE